MGRDTDAPIGRRDRLVPGGGVLPQVGGDDRRAGPRQPARLSSRQLALVEVVPALVGELGQARRQRRQPDDLPGPPRPAVGPVDPEPVRVVPEVTREEGAVGLDARHEPVPRREAVHRDLDRPAEDLGARQPSESVVGVAPGPHRAGDGDRHRPVVGERLHPAGAECRRIRGGGRAPRPVQGDLLPRGLVPDEPERVAADAAAAAHDDAEDGVRGDRRVHGRTAALQDREARRGREVMRRDDRAPRPARQRDRHERAVHDRDCSCR